MRTFENPANGHKETVGASEFVFVLFLGIFALASEGLWAMAFIWFGVSVLLLSLGASELIWLIPIQITMACFVPSALANKYLKQGWREVLSGDSHSKQISTQHVEPNYSSSSSAQSLPGADTPTESSAQFIRLCPFCAEEIKPAAIRCKHCQADLPAQPETTS